MIYTLRVALPLAALSLGLPAVASAQDAADWTIGPIIKGKNYSEGMPLSPDAEPRGWSFAFPYPHVGAGHVHYLTRATDGLPQDGSITLRYRIDAPRGTRFTARDKPGEAPTVSLYFQRAGDIWKMRGNYNAYRWYAPQQALLPVTPGTHNVTVSLDDGSWIGVDGRTSGSDPEGFAAAKAGAWQVGFTFGSPSARGHGVFSDGPARFTLLDFRVN